MEIELSQLIMKIQELFNLITNLSYGLQQFLRLNITAL